MRPILDLTRPFWGRPQLSASGRGERCALGSGRANFDAL